MQHRSRSATSHAIAPAAWRSERVVPAAILLACLAPVTAHAAEPDAPSLQQEVDELKREVRSLQEQIQSLKKEPAPAPLPQPAASTAPAPAPQTQPAVTTVPAPAP